MDGTSNIFRNEKGEKIFILKDEDGEKISINPISYITGKRMLR